MTTFDKLYINGAWVSPSTTETIDVFDSVTEEVMASIPAAAASDVDAAVAAAKAAFESWSVVPVSRVIAVAISSMRAASPSPRRSRTRRTSATR